MGVLYGVFKQNLTFLMDFFALFSQNCSVCCMHNLKSNAQLVECRLWSSFVDGPYVDYFSKNNRVGLPIESSFPVTFLLSLPTRFIPLDGPLFF